MGRPPGRSTLSFASLIRAVRSNIMSSSSLERETSIHLVGLGVSLTSEATIATTFPGVEVRPIAGDADVIPFRVVLSPKNDNPAFRRFLSLAPVLAKTLSNRFNGVTTSSWSKQKASDLIDRCRVFLVASGKTLDLLT